MRELNQYELNEISGGMDGKALEFIFEVGSVLVGIGVFAAFAAGVGAVRLYDYLNVKKA